MRWISANLILAWIFQDKFVYFCNLMFLNNNPIELTRSSSINSSLIFLNSITIIIRHIYKHLSDKGNFLNKSWRDQIWLPHLTFSNTNGNYPLTMDSTGDDSIMIEIIKQGSDICRRWRPLLQLCQMTSIPTLLTRPSLAEPRSSNW